MAVQRGIPVTETCEAVVGGDYPEQEHECWLEDGHVGEHECWNPQCGVKWTEEAPC